MSQLNRKQRRHRGSHNNQELLKIVESQKKQIYFLEREVLRLKKLVPPVDNIDNDTGEVTRINPETKEILTI